MSPRRHLARLPCLALVFTLSCVAVADEVRHLQISDPTSHWSTYIPLVPAIHPPTTHDHEDLIQVWLRLPAEGQIDVRWLPQQQRYTLVYPPGTVADRVEYFYAGRHAPNLANYAPFRSGTRISRDWSVADVRGIRIEESGEQRFRVFRPTSGAAHATLAGWSWPRGNDVAHRRATAALIRHAAETNAPLSDEPMSKSGVQALARLNDCASCHVPNRPRIQFDESGRSIERATDAMGFVVPNAVLQDECVVAQHRPEDVNQEDPYVTVYCADGAAAELADEHEDETWFCQDGSQPRGRRDIAAGLAAGHPYTKAVCDSRRALQRGMTPEAVRAFGEAFTSCGLDLTNSNARANFTP